MNQLGLWLRENPDKRTVQVEAKGDTFVVVCIQHGQHGTGSEVARQAADNIREALEGVGRKLP